MLGGSARRILYITLLCSMIKEVEANVINGTGVSWLVRRGEECAIYMIQEEFLKRSMEVMKLMKEAWKTEQFKGNRKIYRATAELMRIGEQIQVIVLEMIRHKTKCSVCGQTWRT